MEKPSAIIEVVDLSKSYSIRSPDDQTHEVDQTVPVYVGSSLLVGNPRAKFQIDIPLDSDRVSREQGYFSMATSLDDKQPVVCYTNMGRNIPRARLEGKSANERQEILRNSTNIGAKKSSIEFYVGESLTFGGARDSIQYSISLKDTTSAEKPSDAYGEGSDLDDPKATYRGALRIQERIISFAKTEQNLSEIKRTLERLIPGMRFV